MKILIVTQYFWPESFVINEVALSLHKLGHDVHVLTGQPNYPGGFVFEGYSATSFGTKVNNSLIIHRVPLAPRGHGSVLRLFLNYLSFVITASVFGPWLLRGSRFEVILVFGLSPILQAIPAIWFAWIKSARLVTWVQDLWPESLTATGFLHDKKILGAVAAVVRWIYRKNDLLLVPSHAFVEPVKRMSGRTSVVYHPNPGELEFLKSDNKQLPLLELERGFNLVFAGNLGTVQALGTILDAAELLLPHPDIHIVLVGSGSRSEWLQQEVARRLLSNVQLPGRFSPGVMPGILAQASALLVSLSRSPIMSQTVPSKMQAYFAAGRPIIASLDGEGARVLEESGAGVSCPAEDAAALAKAVLELNALPFDALQRMGEAGQIYYQKHFDPALLATRLVQHFSQVLARPKE